VFAASIAGAAFIAGIQMKALSDKMRLPPVRY
jgi:hypothetical protein